MSNQFPGPFQPHKLSESEANAVRNAEDQRAKEAAEGYAVRIGLQILDGQEAIEAGIPQPVVSLSVNPETGILHVGAFHYPASDDGARTVAALLETAAAGIRSELGGEPVQVVERPERATETFMGQPALNPRFNPRPASRFGQAGEH